MLVCAFGEGFGGVFFPCFFFCFVFFDWMLFFRGSVSLCVCVRAYARACVRVCVFITSIKEGIVFICYCFKGYFFLFCSTLVYSFHSV